MDERRRRDELGALDPTIDTFLREAAATSLVSYPGKFSGTERYELVRQLGEGGFGVVFEAVDHRQGGRVALKVLRQARADRLYRFKREFRALAELLHPNLVRLYELTASGRDAFFTMELIEGAPLLEHVDHSPERAREVLRQLAAGLNALHQAGKLHRDVKPFNVMVERGGRVVLLDFGLAVEIDGADTEELAGTPLYMSPEQCAAQPLTAASDFYAVGAVLYEALTGRPPFAGGAMQVVRAKQEADPPPPSALAPNVPPDLDALCVELLARAPEQRPSGAEVLARLSGARGPAPELAARSEPFVGRGAELEALLTGFDESARGRRSVALVRGPSGIGKSALLARFLDEARRRRPDAVVLAGRCYEHESVPYKALDAVADELSRWLKRLPELEAAALLPREVTALLQLLPVLRQVPLLQRRWAERVPSGDAGDARQRGAAALRELLARLADRRPVVICIDDLQWGDADSALLLADLVATPDPPAVCVVGSFREEEATSSPLLGRLLQLRESRLKDVPLVELRLASLAPEEARHLAETILAEAGEDPARAATIAAESGGSPLFVHELARHHAGGDVRLGDLVLERVARLDATARRLLEVAAVVAQPVESALAAEVAETGEALRDALATLRVARLVRARESAGEKLLESYHDRIRVAVVSAIAPERLRALNINIAAALERRGCADAAQIARHLTDGGDRERALGFMVRAAGEAAATLAFDEAARLYREAVALRRELRADDGDVALELAWGDALAASGRGPEAARVFLRVAPRVDERCAADLRRRAAEELLNNGHLDEGYAALGDVLSNLGLWAPRGDSGALGRVVWARARLALRGRKLTTRDPASVSERERLRIDTLGGLSLALWNMDPVMCAALQADHLRLALDSGDRARAALALCLEAAVSALPGAGAHQRTRRLIEEARGFGAGLELADFPAQLGAIEGGVALLEGRWLDAHERSAEAERHLTASAFGHSSVRAMARVVRGMSLFWMGRAGDTARALPSMIREMEERGNLIGWTWLRLLEGWSLGCAGRADDARATIAWVRERLPARGFQLQRWWMELGEVRRLVMERDCEGAWRRVQEVWPQLRPGFVGQVQRVSARWQRANAALACALDRGSAPSRAPLLREARALAQKLERERVPWVDAMARSLRAGLASADGDDETALRCLAEAELLLETHHFEGILAAARRARGRLIGGDVGRALVERAESWTAEQQTTAAANWSQLPGRWPA